MHPFYHVDAFTSRPFSGNPAVVCPLDGPADPLWMQQVAAEMNVSETAFYHPISVRGEREAVEAHFELRWFTPTTEVDLCGHATLASAHILRELGTLPIGATARFH